MDIFIDVCVCVCVAGEKKVGFDCVCVCVWYSLMDWSVSVFYSVFTCSTAGLCLNSCTNAGLVTLSIEQSFHFLCISRQKIYWEQKCKWM